MPYGCGWKARYNIYYTDKIDWLIQSGIPLSQNNKNKEAEKQDHKTDDTDIQDRFTHQHFNPESPIPSGGQDSEKDARLNRQDQRDDPHQADNLTLDQQGWWLWQEYTAKHSQPAGYDVW
jgi:hypothetical protein